MPDSTDSIQDGISTKRLQALADGVFAVAMTLLVLQLIVPVIQAGPGLNEQLTQDLFGLWPRFVTYILSFFIAGMFWLMHHFIFDEIQWYDSTLAWLNILFLLFVSLIPFTTSLLGNYFLEKTPSILYGIQLLIMFFLGFSLFSYSRSKPQLIKSDSNSLFVKEVKLMGYIYFILIAIAIVLAFFFPAISLLIYGSIVLLFILFTGLGKSEKVIAWSYKRQKNSKKGGN